jgi:hypothetical protein
MTKRGKRRLRGKLSERQRVLVHYFCYTGMCEYTQAAMSYMDSDWIRRIATYTDYYKKSFFFKDEWVHSVNKTVHSFAIPFDTMDEAMAHVMERKLRMLQPDYNNGYFLYSYIPYKVTVVRGYNRWQRTIHVTNLGTKV